MKRNQIVLVVLGALMGVVALVAGWFLVSALLGAGAAAEGRNEKYAELQKIYQAKVFPSAESIARVSEDQKSLEAWLATASNLVHKGELRVEAMSPTGFKQTLQSTVRRLSAQPGAINGKVVAADFNFGFDKYLGTSDSLPSQEHVEQLSQQLSVIEQVCKELYAANILSLESVTREAFDDLAAAQAKQEQPKSKKKKKGGSDEGARTQAPAATAGVAGEFFSKQRFTFEFKARPSAFVDALNRLAAMELFAVVAETEFRKTEDPLTKRITQKKPASAGEAVVDPSTLKHGDRIVTDPELDPPVSVKLALDVYTFTGV